MKIFFFIKWIIIFCYFVFGVSEVSAFASTQQFSIPSRGVKYYEVNVPENAKQIRVTISGQTQMLNLALFAPGKDIPSSKNSTWSNLSNWRKAFKCSANRPKAGIWRVKVEGAVHIGKVDKIKSVSGHLEIYVNGISAK